MSKDSVREIEMHIKKPALRPGSFTGESDDQPGRRQREFALPAFCIPVSNSAKAVSHSFVHCGTHSVLQEAMSPPFGYVLGGEQWSSCVLSSKNGVRLFTAISWRFLYDIVSQRLTQKFLGKSHS